VTSRARQREQAEALVRGHGRVMVEFFDEGESRSVLFEHYGVHLWMPEAGGRVDFASEHDEQVMTMLGLSSKREVTRPVSGPGPRWPPRPGSRAGISVGGCRMDTASAMLGRNPARRAA
jgi:hypothetical protein